MISPANLTQIRMLELYPIQLLTPRNTLADQMDWLREQGCHPSMYRTFIGGVNGDHASPIVWNFSDRASQHAILFKLTFGGFSTL